VHRIDDARLWFDPGGGITIHAVTPEGDPVELSADQARAIAAVLEELATIDEAD